MHRRISTSLQFLPLVLFSWESALGFVSLNNHQKHRFVHQHHHRRRQNQKRHHNINANRKRPYTSTTAVFAISEDDEEFLDIAVEYARKGLGNTFPNPAVGCVLVNSDTKEIIGSGFHPQAGYPHAEVFALIEAAGHVSSGVDAAQSIVDASKKDGFAVELRPEEDQEQIEKLTEIYKSDDDNGGPTKLFGNCFEDIPVTAYVTLEPCCHYGQTPPCAASLALAKVDRVVIGYRDPNPKVDGGGVSILKEAGVDVEMAEGDMEEICGDIVTSFVKRITPKDYDVQYSWMNGAKRSALRSLANTHKREESLNQVNWNGKVKAKDEESVDQLSFNPGWMENVDEILWRVELINLRLNKVVAKKKLARRLGQRVADQLGAHVVQAVGHTVLLYRPGVPPALDLEAMIRDKGEDDQSEDD